MNMAMSERDKTAARHAAAVVLLVIYLAVLLYLLFLSDRYGRTEGFTEYHYNLIPFAEIRRYISYRSSFNTELFLVNIVGNVLAFAPFGFLLPLAYRRVAVFWQVTLLGFLFSLLVETMQLLLMVGTFDVDDLILNVTGVMIGYGLSVLFRRAKKPD